MATKLALMEKSARRGLRYEHLDDINEFLRLARKRLPGGRMEPRLIATMHMYVGTILFFANGKLEPRPAALEDPQLFVGTDGESCYRKALEHLLNCEGKSSDFPELIKATLKKLPESRMEALLIANALSKLTDAMIARNEQGDVKLHYSFLPKQWKIDRVSHLLESPRYGVICAHLLASALAYQTAGHLFQCVFQIKKLLYYLIAVSEADHRFSSDALTSVRFLHEWATSVVHKSYQHIDRQQIDKLKDHASGIIPDRVLEAQGSTSASYYSETLELDLLLHQISLKASEEADIKKARVQTGRYLRSRRCNSSLQFSRIRFQMLCMRWNWLELPKELRKEFAGTTVFERPFVQLPDDARARKRIKALTVDSIYCAFQTLGVLNLYGISFMSNNGFLAREYKHLGDWCLILKSFKLVDKTAHKEMVERLCTLLDGKLTNRLDPLMHYTSALEHESLSRGAHERGKSYFRMISDLFILEDDLNDNMYHFCCALDRFRYVSSPSGDLDRREILSKRIEVLEKEYSLEPVL